jgi:hypothetical protein
MARILAVAFAGFCALASWATLRLQPPMLLVAQGCAVVSILVLAGVRSRVGWRGAYSHPLGKVTVVLLIPAQLWPAYEYDES